MPIRNPHEETARAGGRPAYGAGHSSFDRPGGGGGQQSQGDQARQNARRRAEAEAATFRARKEAAAKAKQKLQKAAAEKARISATQPFPRDRNLGGQNVPGSAGFGVLENLGSSNLEKMMSMYDPKGLAYNFLNMLSNAYPGTRDEYGDYAAHKYDPYVYTTSGDFLYQDAEMGEPGAVLVDGEWKKPTLNRLGSALLESGTTGTYDDQGRFTMTDPFPTSSSDMFTGIPTTLTPTNQSAIESSLDELSRNIYGGSPGGPGGSDFSVFYDDYGDLAALYGAGIGQQPKPLGEEEFVPKGSEMLDYMVRVHKDNPYTSLAMARNGGIMNLVK
jgi:hypothetical protein